MSDTRTEASPISAIDKAFRKDHAALMPYFTLGYPDLETSLSVIEACSGAGADIFELGVPFSDPLADGPTIQHSSQAALQNGITVARCLEAVSRLRTAGINTPFVLMSYYNPLYAYGVGEFVSRAAAVGANGIIVPDLPPEEASVILESCRRVGLSVSFLIAPNSPDERVRLVCQRSSGFTYLVSVTGITGARKALPNDLTSFVGRVRKHAISPLAVGFGISTPEQAGAVAKLADGVIVGSALIRKVDQAMTAGRSPVDAAANFVGALRAGMRMSPTRENLGTIP